MRSPSVTSKFCGDDKAWTNWEFKFQNFVRNADGFEDYLDWCKERDDPVTLLEIHRKQAEIRAKGETLDLE